jgi:N-acetylglutamate synthase-like GNAT family acetyltransferase
VVPGFSPTGGSVVEAAEVDSPRGAFVVAFSGPDAVGCGGIRGLTPSIAEIKRLFVRREARGRGLASAMLVALEEQAAELGYGEVRLDTHATGPAGLFRAAGYCAMPQVQRQSICALLVSQATADPGESRPCLSLTVTPMPRRTHQDRTAGANTRRSCRRRHGTRPPSPTRGRARPASRCRPPAVPPGRRSS